MTQRADVQVTYTQETKSGVEVYGDSPIDFYKQMVLQQINGESITWNDLPIDQMIWRFDKHPRKIEIVYDARNKLITYFEQYYQNEPVEKEFRW